MTAHRKPAAPASEQRRQDVYDRVYAAEYVRRLAQGLKTWEAGRLAREVAAAAVAEWKEE